MKINKLEASKVNGLLEFNIKFDPNLNFITGINGSGKTTALKLILGLIGPSHKYLMQIEFETAKLFCTTQDGVRLQISAESKKSSPLILKLNVDGKEIKSEIPFPELESRFVDEPDEEILAYRKFYQSEVVRKIQEYKSPVYLGLNRSIYQGGHIEEVIKYRHRSEYLIKYGKKYRRNQVDQMDASLSEVQELVSDYIKEIADKQPQLTDEFKSKVLENSIRYIDENRVSFSTEIDHEDLHRKKESLIKATKELGLDSFDDQIEMFFEQYEQLGKRISDLEPRIIGEKASQEESDEFSNLIGKAMLNTVQLRGIDKILNLSSIYQEKISELREPLNRLNSILSEFFSQSKKQVKVLPNGRFKITLPNDQTTEPEKLSSGEKQILVMITHLIFYEDRNVPGIFIIDEPELSLHLGWQEIFIESIREASPKTQFILATHSPTIIGGLHNEKYCINIEQ